MKPAYVKLDDTPLSFRWDRDVMWSSGRPDIQAHDRISHYWSRVKLALAVGMAKWVIYRDPVDKVFTDILEAVEASVIDRRYLNLVSSEADRARKYWAINPEATAFDDLWDYQRDLLNPLTGPKWVAARHLLGAADHTTPRDNNTHEVVYLSKLARQVRSKPEVRRFTAWRKDVIARFEESATVRAFYYMSADLLTVPEEELDQLGPILPPEVVDPAFPFNPDRSEDLAHAFLQRLRPAENQFLVPAPDLLKLGVAHPYAVG
jgi:hypothetical protein